MVTVFIYVNLLQRRKKPTVSSSGKEVIGLKLQKRTKKF